MKSPIDLIQSLYGAFARGDMDGIIAVLDPQVSWREADGYPYAGTYIGPEAVKAGVFLKIGSEWSNYTTVPKEYVTEGETVVAIGTYRGTFKATGKTFTAPFVHVWRVRNGRIVYFDQHTDTALVQAALR